MRACRYFFLFVLVQPLLAGAAIYQYVDGSGTPVFTNTPHRGAVRLHLPPVPVLRKRPLPKAVPMRTRPHARARQGISSLAAQLRISPQTQRQRDRRRRQILENELSLEEHRLQDTLRHLAGAARDPREAVRLHAQLTAHQKNIAALRQELASTR
jgi:hypothetical protein